MLVSSAWREMRDAVMIRLGELEKAVMQRLWLAGDACAKDVHAHFAKKRGGSLNTIQSTLDRLYKKGLLNRSKEGYAYYYSPAVTREQLVGQLISDITKDFIKEDEAVQAAFVSLSNRLSQAQLEELEQLIRKQKENLGKGGKQ